jgi:sensor histidine kinase regulating citrate/malate metabolism
LVKNESIKNVKNLDASLLQATLESTADGILVVNGKGKITIPFHSEEDFNRILKLIKG